MEIERPREILRRRPVPAEGPTEAITPQQARLNRQKLALSLFAAVAAFLTAFFFNMRRVDAATTSPAPKASEEEIAAANGMESMYVHMLVEQMRKTVPENELFPKSQGERIYEGMLDYEYADMVAGSGNFGIADQVLAEIQRKR